MAAEVAVSYLLRYYTADGEREVIVDADGIATPADAVRELGLTTVKGQEVRRVRVCPTVPLTMAACEAQVSCNISGANAIMLSGYNSWTDTWERKVQARMRGLYGLPNRLIDKWVLDGSGDYRFTEADPGAGRQHGFGYGYLRYGKTVLLVASLDENNGYTTIRENLSANTLSLSKEVTCGELTVGTEVELMSFALVEASLGKAVDRWLELAHIHARPAKQLVGFSSWYRYYDQIDEKSLLDDLRAMTDLLGARDLGPCLPVFQIDDGYTTVGDWTHPHADRFPSGLASFAQRIKDAGMVAGLWLAPFVCSVDSDVYRNHPDWLLRDKEGEPVCTGTHWNGAYALDTLNSEVREHVRSSLDTVTREWGFRLLKLDFLYGACMLPHGGMNRGQLMADAISLLRDSVADDVMFDLCGVPVSSALGRTEYCRIGPDVGLDWDDLPHMRLLHRERVSTKRSLANTRGRAHLDGKAFRNDPDVFFLRRDVRLNKKQRHHLVNTDAALGGMFLTSDDVASWDDRQRLVFDMALAVFVNRAKRNHS